MKRVNIFLSLPGKNVKRYLLVRCYHSVGALMRCSHAMRALVAPLVAEPAYWSYGVARELRDALGAVFYAKLPPQLDLFFDAWPADIPARPPTRLGQTLSWIWDRGLIRKDDPKSNVVTPRLDLWVRDRVRKRRWAWSWRGEGAGAFDITLIHGWTGYTHDDEGDHWYHRNDSIEHIVRYSDDGIGPLSFFACVNNVALWMDSPGDPEFVHVRGYCVGRRAYHHQGKERGFNVFPLDGVCEVVKK